MASPESTVTLVRERVTQVFRFLKAFAERNVPVRRTLAEHEWVMRLADLPDHPSVQVGIVQVAGASDASEENGGGLDDAPLLRVTRPRLTDPPPPPERLVPWLVGKWGDPTVAPTTREARAVPGAESESMPRMERFDDDPTRVSELASWRLRWEAWAVAERPARAAMRVFQQLYALLGRIERDSERVELVLGDGRLRRRAAAGAIDHPVLLQRVELELDVDGPELRVIDTDRPPELYGAVLVGDDAIPGDKLNALQRELELGGFHPLDRDGTAGFLRRLTALLGPDAVYRETGNERMRDAAPTIARDPVLFLRIRSSGLPAAFERVLEDIERDPPLPTSLSRIVGVESPASNDGIACTDVAPWGEPPDVLFSKPTNLEQVQIARALEQHQAVLVQGPPGTGKSHTIANLVGHLVAQGKRVLVTSHTTKALRVLREHIVEELRPLCVALLEQDLEGRTQLESAVRGIVARLTTAQESQLVREVERLETARSELIAAVEKLAADLRIAREGEYAAIVPVAGSEAVAPAEAAREVARARDLHAWLPGPLSPELPLPLSDEELAALYRTNAELTVDEEDELTQPLPGDDGLLAPEAFANAVAALDGSEPAELGRFWARPADPADAGAVDALAEELGRLTGDLHEMTPWQRALVAAGYVGESERAIWLALRDQVQDAVTRHHAAREILLTHDVAVRGVPPTAEVRATVDEMREHVRGGKSLGALARLLHRPWKVVLESCRVDGAAPATARHLEALAAHLEVAERRHALAKRWGKQAVPIGLPAMDSLPDPPEAALDDYAKQFEPLLDWWTARWAALTRAMQAAALDWRAFHDHAVARAAPAAPFDRDCAIITGALTEVVAARRSAIRRRIAADALARLDEHLAGHGGTVCRRVRAAVRAHDAAGYADALDDLRALTRKLGALERRHALLQRLGGCAPAWAAAIRAREGLHGKGTLPLDAPAAWRWRQLHQELERRATLDERDVTRRMQQRRAELRQVTTQLIDRKAWLAQLRRTDLAAQQALIGWADTQKKIGKGTGKRVPELQARAREQLVVAREAVPVWIMPLARVAESFDPRKGRFDVVIVDEASQSDVTGLLAFYAGERVVVVGDHEQVSPSAVGQKVEDTRALIAQHLGGIPNAHLYDGQTSIYDLARQAFGGTIALREHFRCVPDIIDFSNYLAYDGQIRPLRDPATAPTPHVAELVVPVYAPPADKVNVDEARWIAALLGAMIEAPELAGKSIGAITLVGEDQAFEIQQRALEVVGAVELQRRRFAAGNPAQFQGDERDIVLLSMVDRPTGGRLRLRQELMFKQRFNVAASRAKDHLWLVHSLDPDRDLQSGDLRRRLIEHVRDPGALRRAAESAASRAESMFERLVIEGLVAAGFQVTPQVEIGRYRIDMVISDGANQVAVECDGDRYHPAEQIPDDLARQAVLERAGWRFVRIRGTRFFRDPESTLQEVIDEIERLGVRRAEPAVVAQNGGGRRDGLRDAIIRRAAAIMQQRGWVPGIPSDDVDGQRLTNDEVEARQG